jgi:hypothetical protein
MSLVLSEHFTNNYIANALATRRTERSALLAKITEVLTNDPRIVAAWVWGSLGRDEQDDISDIDLRVVVADSHIDEVCQDRRSFAAQIGEMVFYQEAPQNRPVGGAFLLTHYVGRYGSQEVDWTWQPQSCAAIWPDVHVIFDRTGLPQIDKMPWAYLDAPERTPLEQAVSDLGFFWTMLVITTKQAARTPHVETLEYLRWCIVPLSDAATYAKVPCPYDRDNIPVHATPQQKIQLLRDLAAFMEAVMALIEGQGANVQWAFPPYAQRFLSVVEKLVREL